MAQGSQFLRVAPGTIGDADTHPICKASSTYGGFTVIAATLFPGAAGTCDAVLQNYGATGTVAGGTVAGASGGSAAVTADTAVSLTVTAANQFIDSGEWLVLKMDGALPANSLVLIEYVDGITSQG